MTEAKKKTIWTSLSPKKKIVFAKGFTSSTHRCSENNCKWNSSHANILSPCEYRAVSEMSMMVGKGDQAKPVLAMLPKDTVNLKKTCCGSFCGKSPHNSVAHLNATSLINIKASWRFGNWKQLWTRFRSACWASPSMTTGYVYLHDRGCWFTRELV